MPSVDEGPLPSTLAVPHWTQQASAIPFVDLLSKRPSTDQVDLLLRWDGAVASLLEERNYPGTYADLCCKY